MINITSFEKLLDTQDTFVTSLLQYSLDDELRDEVCRRAGQILDRDINTQYNITFDSKFLISDALPENLLHLIKYTNQRVSVLYYLLQNEECYNSQLIYETFDYVCQSRDKTQTSYLFRYILPRIKYSPEFEDLFSRAYDLWISDTELTYDGSVTVTGKFLEYNSTLEKYKKTQLQNLHYSAVTKHSKLYLEEILKLTHETLDSVSYWINFDQVPIEHPEKIRSQLSHKQKTYLVRNPCVSSDLLIKLYFKTTSKELQKNILKNPNCPPSLKLKQVE